MKWTLNRKLYFLCSWLIITAISCSLINRVFFPRGDVTSTLEPISSFSKSTIVSTTPIGTAMIPPTEILDTPTVVEFTGVPYPGPEGGTEFPGISQPSETPIPYPGPGGGIPFGPGIPTSPTITESLAGLMPSPTGQEPGATSVVGQVSPSPNATFSIGTSVLSPSPTSSSTIIVSGTPTVPGLNPAITTPTTNGLIPTPSPTLTFTPGPTVTYTSSPTLTPSPTFTPTLFPLPPWLSAQLNPTNPASVVLASGKVKLIMFFAFWSGASLAMAPIIHGLERQYQSRMNFIFLDIDDPATAQLKQQLRFQLPPHIVLLDENGIVLRQWVGYATAQELISVIISALQ